MTYSTHVLGLEGHETLTRPPNGKHKSTQSKQLADIECKSFNKYIINVQR